MKLTKEQAKTLLEEALSTGADYCDIFLDEKKSLGIGARNGDVRDCNYHVEYGFGVRIMKGEDSVYGYENGFSYDKVLEVIKNLRTQFTGTPNKPKEFKKEKTFKSKVKLRIADVSGDKKKDFLINLTKRIKAENPLIETATASIGQNEKKNLIVNSNGVYQHYERPYTRLYFSVTAKKDDKLESAGKLYSIQGGYELIDSIKTLDEDIKYQVDLAIRLLDAKEIKPGKMDVVLENGWGGVIFHEACGHPLEASSVAFGLSPFAGKIGEKVASDVVTAYDDGTIPGAWGSIDIDDEGNEPTKNLLIENGILKGYMIDYQHTFRMNMPVTGAARRQSYRHLPTSRMTSTYIASGKSKKEDLFKDIKLGFYAKSFNGGQVNPSTGEFNFNVQEGYYIRDGKIAELVKGAMLIGNGGTILNQIDMVANDLELAEGMCGAASGSIEVNVGQPTIRVRGILVGGGDSNA